MALFMLAGSAEALLCPPVVHRPTVSRRASEPVMMPKFIKDLFGGDKPEAGDNPFETFINMVQGKTEKKAEEAKAAEAPASEGEPADEPAAAE
mmetsp:Transcript_19921/g.58841  ORF Transcript_19921/g.58841 Transcript_19921/m.58841 type:complete len:93 (-) Transcript_19921:284-562(-)